LNLVGRPLSPADVLIKRSFDIVISAGALVLLSSLFLIMAILIKLDSPGSGPVLTASLRFQTGAVPDRKVPYDDDARRRSSRIRARTTHGSPGSAAGCAATIFDELPQLLNVLRGEMTLVGPRPHALAHD
jgi:lipopolysaccharide/colanic/teichoic acid biosynthesis glycosyltransferase